MAQTAGVLLVIFGAVAGTILWCQALSSLALEQLRRRQQRRMRRQRQIEQQLMALVHGPKWRA